jgi:NitT/TauT family transport system substrate-binding protein
MPTKDYDLRNGWEAAKADPEAAVAATIKAFPDAKASVIAAGLKYTLQLLATPATQGHPMGWMSGREWRRQLALLRKYGGMKGSRPVSAFYTNRFVTAAS